MTQKRSAHMHGWLGSQRLQRRSLHQPRRKEHNETRKEANTLRVFEWLKNARRRLGEENEYEGRKEADVAKKANATSREANPKLRHTCYIHGCHLELLFAHSSYTQSVRKNAQRLLACHQHTHYLQRRSGAGPIAHRTKAHLHETTNTPILMPVTQQTSFPPCKAAKCSGVIFFSNRTSPARPPRSSSASRGLQPHVEDMARNPEPNSAVLLSARLMQ